MKRIGKGREEEKKLEGKRKIGGEERNESEREKERERKRTKLISRISIMDPSQNTPYQSQ